MSRSCVCGGSNENCRFCGGTGVVPDALSEALVPPCVVESQRVPKGKPEPPPKWMRLRLVVCPECGARPRNLDRHRRKVHGVTETVKNVPTQKMERS